MEGKQITKRTPQEERDHKQRENLLTAITKLTALGKQFERPECWEEMQIRKAAYANGESRYYTFAELFAMQSEGQQPEAFARRKAETLENRLKEIRELITAEHYEAHPVYKYAEQYISYLLNIGVEDIQPANNTASLNDTKKKRPGCIANNQPFADYFTDTNKHTKVLAVLKRHHKAGEAAPAARIIQAAQQLGFFPNNMKAAPLHRSLSKELEKLGSVEAFRRVFNTESDPNEIARYKKEIENAQP